jgi:hypothetical protein
MERRGPKDDTREYSDRTLTQARLQKDYISGDVRGTLGVISSQPSSPGLVCC